MTIALLIKNAAILRFGSIRKFEDVTGFSRRTVGTLVIRKKSKARLATLRRVAVIFGFDIEDLIKVSEGKKAILHAYIGLNDKAGSDLDTTGVTLRIRLLE